MHRELVEKYLQCPVSKLSLVLENDYLVSQDGKNQFKFNINNIPLFATQFLSHDAKFQKEHYDKIFAAYIENIELTHTIVYTKYLDEEFLELMDPCSFSSVLEVCGGKGDGIKIIEDRVEQGWLLDISEKMLENGKKTLDIDKIVRV